MAPCFAGTSVRKLTMKQEPAAVFIATPAGHLVTGGTVSNDPGVTGDDPWVIVLEITVHACLHQHYKAKLTQAKILSKNKYRI